MAAITRSLHFELLSPMNCTAREFISDCGLKICCNAGEIFLKPIFVLLFRSNSVLLHYSFVLYDRQHSLVAEIYSLERRWDKTEHLDFHQRSPS